VTRRANRPPTRHYRRLPSAGHRAEPESRQAAARELVGLAPYLFRKSPAADKARARFLATEFLGLNPVWIQRCCSRPEPFEQPLPAEPPAPPEAPQPEVLCLRNRLSVGRPAASRKKARKRPEGELGRVPKHLPA
jgi:hypothetical protein